MVERPRYQRRGARLNLPRFEDAASQAAARGAANTGQALGRMTQFFLQQTQQQAEIAGAEYGALNAPTREQIEDAYKKGGAVDLPGGNLTVYDRAAKRAAFNLANDQLEILARKKISEIVLNAYETKIPANVLADKIDEVIAGYAGTFDDEAPTVALQFRAKIGIYANNQYASYSKYKIGQNQSNALATLLAEHKGSDESDHTKSLALNTEARGR